MSLNKLIYGYWPVPGRGQHIRYLLELAGADYEEVRYTNRDDWFGRDKLNLGLPFPNLPYLIDGDLKLTESETIFDYILDKYNLVELRGKGNDKYLVDIVRNFFQDFLPKFSGFLNQKDEVEKAKSLNETILPKLKYLESFVSGKEYLIGGYFTAADIYFLTYLPLVKSRVPEVYQNFAATFDPHLAKLEKIPQIAAYIQSGRRP